MYFFQSIIWNWKFMKVTLITNTSLKSMWPRSSSTVQRVTKHTISEFSIHYIFFCGATYNFEVPYHSPSTNEQTESDASIWFGRYIKTYFSIFTFYLSDLFKKCYLYNRIRMKMLGLKNFLQFIKFRNLRCFRHSEILRPKTKPQ